MGFEEIYKFMYPRRLCQLVRYLEEAGTSANINEIHTESDGTQDTVLSIALIDDPHPGLVFVLLKYGADPNMILYQSNADDRYITSGFGALGAFDDQMCNERNQSLTVMLRAYGALTNAEFFKKYNITSLRDMVQ